MPPHFLGLRNRIGDLKILERALGIMGHPTLAGSAWTEWRRKIIKPGIKRAWNMLNLAICRCVWNARSAIFGRGRPKPNETWMGITLHLKEWVDTLGGKRRRILMKKPALILDT